MTFLSYEIVMQDSSARGSNYLLILKSGKAYSTVHDTNGDFAAKEHFSKLRSKDIHRVNP